MFYLEDDSDVEKKAYEGFLSKAEDVYHEKAPAGILVSYLYPCPGHFAWLLNLDNTERRGKSTHQKKVPNAFSLENVSL